MKPIRLKKTRENLFNYDFIDVIESRINRIASVKEMPWGGNSVNGKVYEYEYLCVCWDENGHKELIPFCETDFNGISESYEVID